MSALMSDLTRASATAAVGSRVIAFEPGMRAREQLRRNVVLNNATDRTHIRPEAVGDRIGEIRFTAGRDTVNKVDENGSVRVPLTTLDTALSDENPILIKIDVEGFEPEVINGARETLSGGVDAVIAVMYFILRLPQPLPR